VAPSLGGKLGIDATHKTEAEGGRGWPERIEMTQEVRDAVTARWSELGLDALAPENGRVSKGLRQKLRL
jgi:3-polyprenyl-4-hydroxybenzoate decarboxylase